MTLEEMVELFEKHDGLYLTEKSDRRQDLAAFNLLDKLVPGDGDIISCAEHDEYWISITPEDLASAANEENIKFLIGCGLRYDEDVDSFAFFA